MKKISLYLLFVMCSVISVAQQANFNDFEVVGAMTNVGDITQYLAGKGFQYACSQKQTEYGASQTEYRFTKNCMIKDNTLSFNEGDKYSYFNVFVYDANNVVCHVQFFCGRDYDTYSQILSQSEEHGYTFKNETTEESGDVHNNYVNGVRYVSFIQHKIGTYCVSLRPRGLTYAPKAE